MRKTLLFTAIMLLLFSCGTGNGPTVSRKADKTPVNPELLVGVWQENPDEDAVFELSADSVFYPSHPDRSYAYTLRHDTLIFHLDGYTDLSVIRKLTADSLVLVSPYGDTLVLTRRAYRNHSSGHPFELHRIMKLKKGFSRPTDFAAAIDKIAVRDDSTVRIYDLSGRLSAAYRLPEPMRKTAFDANGHLQMMNLSETLVYKIRDRHFETFPVTRPEDWYILLDSAKYLPFFSDVTWIPACHYNAWRQKRLHTRFDYGYRLYSISDKDIYLVLYRMVAHIYDDGLYRFGKGSIILSDYLNENDRLLRVSGNKILYFNGHSLVAEDDSGMHTYRDPEAQEMRCDVNAKGDIFVLKVFSDRLEVYQLIPGSGWE